MVRITGIMFRDIWEFSAGNLLGLSGAHIAHNLFPPLKSMKLSYVSFSRSVRLI